MKLIKSILIIIVFFTFTLGCAKKDESGSIVQSDIEAPSTPSGLAAQEASGMINLSWSRNQETDIAKYRLYRSGSNISNASKVNLVPVQKISFAEQGYIEETGTFFADADVITGSTYYYRVSALDRNNNESNKSNQVIINYKDHVAPAKPVGLSALTGSKKGEIDLSWTTNTEIDFLGYNIYGASQGGAVFSFISSLTENNYTVTDLIPGDNYFFKITALDNSNNESEYSDEVICKAKGDKVAPAMPTGLTVLAGASGSGRVTLSWAASTEPDLAKYRVYRSTNGSLISYTSIDDVIGQPPDTTFLAQGLLDTALTYYFKISAIDDSDNESDWSVGVNIKAP